MGFKNMNFKGNKNDNPFAGQDKRNFFEYISDNKKIVMPIILVVAVALTIIIALNANKKDNTVLVENATTEVNEDGSYVVPEVDLEVDAYEDVNALMATYFNAYATGDMDTIKSIYTGLESTEELRLQEVSQYITGIPTVKVYTKPGPIDGSYVAYVYTEVQFQGYDTPLPGMQTMFVCTNDSGDLYINGDVVDDRITEYISNISLQADVVDLNNEVAAKYNDIIAANEELATFLSDMSASIQVSVGEALAAIESGETPAVTAADGEENAEATEGDGTEGTTEETTEAGAEGEDAEPAEAETEETQEQPATKKIKAIDVVNIRSSDSETADKIAKTEIGQEFTQLEALENGWSKIEYNGGTAYVKTQYFEEVKESTESTESTETTEETAENTTETEETKTEEPEKTEETKASVDPNKTGKMRVSETVRQRKSQSTDAEILHTIYAGETVNVKEQYANGWAKIEYNGDTGYIKKEYLID
jgi:hypothetical protein